MKVVLDLSRLLADGEITAEEFERLSRLSARETGGLAFNILVALGVFAVVSATLALVPTVTTAIGLGLGLMAGAYFMLRRRRDLSLLATICLVIGALMFGGGWLIQAEGSAYACLFIAVFFGGVAALAGSAMLAALAVTAFAGALGTGTFYAHAAYALAVTRPLVTIVGCSLLAFAADRLSRGARPERERLWIVVARAAIFYVNLGFWVGSLWGDGLSTTEADHRMLSPVTFALAWAAALILVGLWAARQNRRLVVTMVTVFGAIHAYTQWFEHLSATPLSVLLAGLLTLAIALGLWRWHERHAAAAKTEG